MLHTEEHGSQRDDMSFVTYNPLMKPYDDDDVTARSGSDRETTVTAVASNFVGVLCLVALLIVNATMLT